MRLADVLEEARRRAFVGRDAELARFTEALDGCSARRVFLVHGVGGIGKSTLLAEFHARALATGRPAVLIDGREVDPSPDGVRAALARSLDGRGTRPGELPGLVLQVDHYEGLVPADAWVRGQLVPELPADGVVVLAGRDAPDPAWRRMPGWKDLGAVVRLDCLDDGDSTEYLARVGIPPAVRPALVRLSRGHPLALALLADLTADGEPPGELADAPDLVSALLEGVVSQVPDEARAAGLATCALAWSTTQDLLELTVGAAAPEVWTWLAGQPYTTLGPRGLVLHDLAREVLSVELERRSPERWRRLHRIVHDQVVTGIRTSTGIERQHAAQQLLHLHRRSPLTSAIWSLRSRGSAAVVPGTAEEQQQVRAVVARFLGPADADLAGRWLAAAPESLQVVRQAGRVAAFAVGLLLPTGSPLDREDAVVRAALAHADRTAPARPGERIHLVRYMGGAEAFERDPYAVLVASVESLTTWLTEPLAWSFAAPTDEEFWGPFLDYLAFEAVAEVADAGRRSVLHAMDWRRLSPDRWMDLMNDRERTGATGPPPAALLRPTPLGREDFAAAVRTALRDLHRDDRLAAGPLMGSRLAEGPAGPDAALLRSSLRRGVGGLGRDPRGPALQRVLDRTFLRPAPTQEAAAEVLGLPFSTYRRHLTAALDDLVALLWAVETGAAALPPERPAADGLR